MAQLIGPMRLAELLATTAGTLTYWEGAGFITANATDKGKRYDVSEIDAVLANGCRNLAVAPTLDDITNKRVTLLRPEQAATLLDLTNNGVHEVMRRRQIGAVKFLREFRYDLASVLAYRAARNNDQNIPRPTVEHILGVARPAINNLVAQGRLQDASDTYRRRVSRASLLALIDELLPDWVDPRTGNRWIDPRDWLEDRLASDRPLLFARQVTLTQTDTPRIRELMENHELQYIHTPFGMQYKDRLILPDSWLAYIERTETPLTDAQLAEVFGVSRQSISNWRNHYPGCLACPAHNHLDDTLYYTCVIILLRQYLPHGKGSSPLKWYRARVEQHVPVLTLVEAASILQVRLQEVYAMIDRGELHGLRTPGGHWTLSRHAVIRTRDARSKQRKAAQSE